MDRYFQDPKCGLHHVLVCGHSDAYSHIMYTELYTHIMHQYSCCNPYMACTLHFQHSCQRAAHDDTGCLTIMYHCITRHCYCCNYQCIYLNYANEQSILGWNLAFWDGMLHSGIYSHYRGHYEQLLNINYLCTPNCIRLLTF